MRDTAGDSTPVVINSDGNVGIGTYANGLFNAAAGVAKLAVVGSSASTNIAGNTEATLAIVNTDQTAGNTAGLHFARADTDDTPNYAGASIVAMFSDAQVTGEYPKADMVFLTSTAANAAPSEKLRINSAGNVGIGIAPSASNLTVAAGTTAVSSLNIPHGAAPTSPVNGDMWTTTAGLYVRINGATVGPLS